MRVVDNSWELNGVRWSLGGGFCRDELVGDGLRDLVGLETARANPYAANGSVRETDLHFLEIREETPARDARGFQTDPTRFLGETPPGNGSSDNRFFTAYRTCLHKMELY